MEFPSYTTESGFPGSITDMIQDRVDNSAVPNELRRIRWTSSYQGETSYESYIGRGGRLRFRWGKCPWVWSWTTPGTKYWNFASEEEFQRIFNGSWGMLHRMCANPVDAETLANFRALYVSNAVTGYFDHLRQRWVVCEPTERELGTETWKLTPRYREFCAERKLAA